MTKGLFAQLAMPGRQLLRVRGAGGRVERAIVKEHRLERALDDVAGMVGRTIEALGAAEHACVLQVLAGRLGMVVLILRKSRHPREPNMPVHREPQGARGISASASCSQPPQSATQRPKYSAHENAAGSAARPRLKFGDGPVGGMPEDGPVG